MKWYERADVLDHIVQSYAGVDNVDGRQQRQFIWDEPNGDLVIGNTRAFTDHLSAKFELRLTTTEWSGVHAALRAMGEVARVLSPRVNIRGTKFKNQEPKTHVIRRGPAAIRHNDDDEEAK